MGYMGKPSICTIKAEYIEAEVLESSICLIKCVLQCCERLFFSAREMMDQDSRYSRPAYVDLLSAVFTFLVGFPKM